MFFIHPMWQDEVQRIGMQKCTPAGYKLRGWADLVGFAGLLTLLGMPIYFVWIWFAGTFERAHWSLIAIPIGIGLVSEVLYACSCWLADRKAFTYDYARRESSWMQAGSRCVYTYDDYCRESSSAG